MKVHSNLLIFQLMIVMRTLWICIINIFDVPLEFYPLLPSIIALMDLLQWVWALGVYGVAWRPRLFPKILISPFILPWYAGRCVATWNPHKTQIVAQNWEMAALEGACGYCETVRGPFRRRGCFSFFFSFCPVFGDSNKL